MLYCTRFLSTVVFLALLVSSAQSSDETVSTKTLVASLGSKSFASRERAQKELQRRIDCRLYRELVKQLPAERDQEIRRRAQEVLAKYYASHASLCQVDLRGQKIYPHMQSLPAGYTLAGPWKGLERVDIINKYQRMAEFINPVDPEGRARRFGFRSEDRENNPDATRIFVAERVKLLLDQAIAVAKDEQDLERLLKEGMAPIQKDLDMLIGEEKKPRGMGLVP